ncbi:MAG: dihydroorotase [Candidatus Kapaibacterium sp.]
MNVYFKNIRVISPVQDLDKELNLWLRDGKIIHCDEGKAAIDNETEEIEARGWVCSPGMFDMQVHFREPGFEYKEETATGAAAAANGGITGVVCMPNTDPVIDNATVIEYILGKAKGLLTDVHLSGCITRKREGKLISSMLEMREAGALFFTDDGDPVMDSETMRRAFDYASTADLMLSQHCEEKSLTAGFAMNESALSYKLGLKGYPTVAEDIIVARDIMLAEHCGNRRYHVQHISSAGAVRLVRDAKKRGLRISCEAAPHHFSLSDGLLESYDTNLKMNPPLRSKDDIEAIIEGLADGTIDAIATDHAPHALHEKDVEYELAPYGIIGLETSLAVSLTYLIHKDRLSINELINKMSVNPRRILGLTEIKIEKNADANLTIFDPDEEWIVNKSNFKSKSGNSPYIGMKLKGKPKFAVNNNMIHQSTL